jgi:hypothetical protein|tara:strand:- start:150 stop:482 length:333 start_codon:yes stop_codon:yes gene_type:complete
MGSNGNGQVQTAATRVSNVVLDPAIIAVMSASLIAPFFVPRINNVLDSVPILRDHKSLASLIAGIVVFGVAKMPKIPTILSAVIVGVAGAFILTAVLPLYTQVTNRGVGQ